MKFYQRLAFYLFGLLIGGIFVFYFLNAKADAKGVSFCYLPNCRVLKELRSKPFEYSISAEKNFTEGWISKEDIKNTLTYGDVDFDRSNIKVNNAKKYMVEGKTTQQIPIVLELHNYPKKVVLVTITKK